MWVIGALFSPACAEHPADRTCVSELPIVGGESAEAHGVPFETSSALGGLYLEGEDGGIVANCTVTRLRRQWVVTAAHCVRNFGLTAEVPLARAFVSFAAELPVERSADCAGETRAVPTSAPPPAIALSSFELHPRLDLALIHIQADSGATLPLATVPPEAGAPVTLAGFGVTEGGEIGSLRFVASTIAAAGGEVFVTDSGADAGACQGDSGGPCLSRAGDTWSVSGVLSRGAPSCRGSDEYVSLWGGTLRTWIEEVVAMPDGG